MTAPKYGEPPAAAEEFPAPLPQTPGRLAIHVSLAGFALAALAIATGSLVFVPLVYMVAAPATALFSLLWWPAAIVASQVNSNRSLWPLTSRHRNLLFVCTVVLCTPALVLTRFYGEVFSDGPTPGVVAGAAGIVAVLGSWIVLRGGSSPWWGSLPLLAAGVGLAGILVQPVGTGSLYAALVVYCMVAIFNGCLIAWSGVIDRRWARRVNHGQEV